MTTSAIDKAYVDRSIHRVLNEGFAMFNTRDTTVCVTTIAR